MLDLQGISKQYGSKVLFEGADAHLGHRSRLALIGPNGAGKSTLIKIILGLEHADTGRVSRARHLAIGYLAQEVPKFSGRTVLEETIRLGGRRDEILATKQELEESFTKNANPSEEDLERYGRILEEMEHLDEYRIEARAKEILTGMGFSIRDFDRPLDEFSGGWLMRVALSRVLLMEPDLLLLDEPTNHLDLESLLWLEEFLRGYRGAMLLVSHDTEFLNRLVTEVLEIDQRRLFSYRGNLDAYALQKAERLKIMRSQAAGQEARIAELQSFVDRFGAKATKARQAQSRMKQIERIEAEKIELPDDRETVRFRFPPAPHSGREVVTMRRARVSFGEKTVFKDLDWVVQRGSRVAIVGVNGAGKTTLLKLLSGTIEASAGEIKMGHMVQVGYYAQHQAETLDLKKTVLQTLEDAAPQMTISRVRAIGGAFLFSGDAIEKKCGVLSGGEKARVALAKLLLSPSNFLLLDEPTNHLDVESRGVLLEALQDYEGTLCLVSHDRSFVSPLVDSVLEITSTAAGDPSGQGSRVHMLIGGYEDYLTRKLDEARTQSRLARDVREPAAKTAPGRAATKTDSGAQAVSPGQAIAPEAADAPKTPSNNQRRSWERERDKLEGDITRLEKDQAEVTALLADVATYEDKEKSMAAAERQRKLSSELHQKLSRWEELCTMLGT